MITLALDDRSLQELADVVTDLTHVRRTLDLIGDEPLETCGECEDARDTLRHQQERLEDKARQLLSVYQGEPRCIDENDDEDNIWDEEDEEEQTDDDEEDDDEDDEDDDDDAIDWEARQKMTQLMMEHEARKAAAAKSSPPREPQPVVAERPVMPSRKKK